MTHGKQKEHLLFGDTVSSCDTPRKEEQFLDLNK